MRASEFVQEGVNDPAIFKLVFVVGGPGSGKSYVSRQLGLNAMGFVTVNSDDAFEYLMKKHDIDPKMPPEEKEKRDTVRARAKEITGKKSDLAIQGRLGVHIDGTGDDYDKIANLKKNFERLGYDSAIVVVNTKLDIARQRNQMRARTVPDKIVTNSWYDVQDNIGRFANLFSLFYVIDNNGDMKQTDAQITKVHTRLQDFAKQPPSKPVAKDWIASQKPQVTEKWSKKYKRSIDCSHPKGFSQRAHCQGRKKANEAQMDEVGKFINDALRKAGYEFIGKGYDAQVWMKDLGTVVKILMPEGQENEAIESFKTFYKFVKQNPSPNLPVFKKVDGHEVYKFSIKGKPYMQFGMEQLYPIKEGSLDEWVIWMMADLSAKGMDWGKAKNEMMAEKGKFAKQFSAQNDSKMLEYKSLYDTLLKLYKAGMKKGYGWDPHTENVMTRGDGTLVITDPWSV
jgi:dephospho-CoA kinase